MINSFITFQLRLTALIGLIKYNRSN